MNIKYGYQFVSFNMRKFYLEELENKYKEPRKTPDKKNFPTFPIKKEIKEEDHQYFCDQNPLFKSKSF